MKAEQFTMHERVVVSANMLRVRVGTTGPCGGDSGHGCRTVLELADASGTDIEAQLVEGGVRISLGGDCELYTLIESLEWAAETLRKAAWPQKCSLRDVVAEMLAALQNMAGMYDTPVSRLRIDSDFHREACQTARDAIAKAVRFLENLENSP